MNELVLLFQAIGQLLWGLTQVGGAVLALAMAHWVILCFIGYFLFFVRWPDLREQADKGGWVAIGLLYLLVSLTWGLTSEPIYRFGDWSIPSIGEKFLVCAIGLLIAICCAALQENLKLTPTEVEIAGPPEAESAGHGHGHDDHHH